MTEEIEIRSFKIELRADVTNPPRIEGYAATFNVQSEDMGFREIIEPGFFDDVLSDDARALFNHDRNFVLGRKSNGTLAMMQDATGLRVAIDPPQTQLINDLVLAPMKRGDINEMSFAFTVKPDGDRIERNKDGTVLRTLKKGGALRLYDVSIVTEPAYPQTSAQVRSKIQELQQANPQAESDGSEALTVRQMARRRRLQIADRSIK